MKRRTFIKNTAASTALISVGGIAISCTEQEVKQITILHTNDVHSHIDPFGPEDGRNANKGGVARRATLIQRLRQENPNTLLLDAGDIFQGTPYFNYFGGEVEFKLMSLLKYDAATLGNHDFDNSIEGFHNQLPNANFDFVCANYDFKNTILNTLVKPYKIFFKSGIKIGVFGLGIELHNLVSPELFKETKYLDPIEITKDISKELKENENCDLVICLSHLGYHYKNSDRVSDLKLAAATKYIDLIIGGHTHTFLPKPTLVKNLDNETVIVNQVGAYGVNLGRIDFYFDKQNNKETTNKTIIV